MFLFLGEYVVSIKFNDEHIPDSPFRVPVLPSSGDARKVTVEALKQKGLEVRTSIDNLSSFNGSLISKPKSNSLSVTSKQYVLASSSRKFNTHQ